jgi:hypothetical protein
MALTVLIAVMSVADIEVNIAVKIVVRIIAVLKVEKAVMMTTVMAVTTKINDI